jgi:hypothetical protein
MPGAVFFHLLGAQSQDQQVGAGAGRAGAVQFPFRAAMMAAQAAAGAMDGQMGVAARAFGVPAAVVTDIYRCIAATVQKDERLIASLQVLVHGLLERGG